MTGRLFNTLFTQEIEEYSVRDVKQCIKSCLKKVVTFTSKASSTDAA